MKFALPNLTAAVAIAWSMSAPLHAAEAADAADAESSDRTIVVTGLREAKGYVPGETLAAKIPAELRDIPQTVDVVPEALLRDQRALSIQDALKNVPGVGLSHGDGQRDQVTIRGFAASDEWALHSDRFRQPDRVGLHLLHLNFYLLGCPANLVDHGLGEGHALPPEPVEFGPDPGGSFRGRVLTDHLVGLRPPVRRLVDGPNEARGGPVGAGYYPRLPVQEWGVITRDDPDLYVTGRQ